MIHAVGKAVILEAIIVQGPIVVAVDLNVAVVPVVVTVVPVVVTVVPVVVIKA